MKDRFYKVLGLKKTATAEQVKKSYRTKAKKLHPDRGGDPAKFQELHLAYEVLIDDDRRRRYDETGEYDETVVKGDFLEQDVKDCVFALLMHALVEGEDPAREVMDAFFGRREPTAGRSDGVMTKMHKGLKQMEDMTDNQEKSIRKEIGKLQKVVGKFVTEDEENILDGMVRAQIAASKRKLETLKSIRDTYAKVKAFLGRYTFKDKSDAKPKPQPKFKTLTGFHYEGVKYHPQSTITVEDV